MKTIPPTCPEPETGPKYWRSLDHLAEKPEFREWVEKEFPSGISACDDPLSRRHFMKIMSASFLLAGLGLTGCRRPEENIYPFAKMPENYAHGVPQHFATSMPVRGGAQPLLVKAMDGRPIKIEGNPQHPLGRLGTDHFAQASILNLYDPDRAMRITQGGNEVAREAGLDYLAKLSKELAAKQGAGLCFLADRSSSPSRARLQAELTARYPQARWFVHEPVDFHVQTQSASRVFGQAVTPYYQLDQAKIIVSLDSDFLGNEEDSARLTRDFVKGRRIEKAGEGLNRLYVAESVLSLTGMNADHRLRLPPSALPVVAAQLAAEVISQSGATVEAGFASALQALVSAQALSDLDKFLRVEKANWLDQWIAECAKDLAASQGAGIVMAGHRQPLVVQMLAQVINHLLGNTAHTVVYKPAADTATAGLAELAQALNGGQVETLIILGANPVYSAPADLDWARTQRKARTIVRLGDYEDETCAVCDWHFPAAHYLESWGDTRTSDGTLVPIQPLIEPLFAGFSELEFLARVGGVEPASAYEITRETFKSLPGEKDVEGAWKKFLHDGFRADSAGQPVEVQLNWAALGEALRGATAASKWPDKDNLELVLHRDYSVDDGRFSNNGWLQELPDPISKITWDNAVMVSPHTATALGLASNDVVDLELGGGKVSGTVAVQPGLADYTVACALGYGRAKAGRVGSQVGFNAYPLRQSNALHHARGLKLSRTGKKSLLSITQEHGSMEGRPIIREANLEQFNRKPDFAKNMGLEAHTPNLGPLYPPPKLTGLHQWGMVVDLNACVGCTACMVACQSENNIPIVGKEQVRRGREMHWIRIDRYYTSNPAEPKSAADNPQVINQPMMCQHCESAPCENVCPVNATVHDEEGLNLMVYNRCVGTRYCSNNCPYKVRRFNYFDYNKRPLNKLYQGPLAKRPADEWELVKLVKNPDVTVRMRGVMEKCTFCVQRIEQAKIGQKIKAGPSGDVRVPDGTITPACAQACPAEAIVFGDIADPESRVSKLKQQPRNYSVLGFLATKPRTTYLARVRNPNPRMPDYLESPNSLEDYSRQNASPLEVHGGGAHAEGHSGGAAVKEKGAH